MSSFRRVMTGCSLTLVVCLAGAAAGCKKKSTGLRCKIPSAPLERLRAASDTVEVSEADRAAFSKLLVERCQGWPSGIQAHIALQTGGPEARAANLDAPVEAAQKELDRLLDGLCPGLAARLEKALEARPPIPVKDTWEHCRLERFGVMTQRELGTDWYSNMHAILVYDLLRKGKMDHRAARTLARLLMNRGRWALREGEMTLPLSPARTESTYPLEVQVSASAILLQGRVVAGVKAGQVEAGARGGEAAGFLIESLHAALKRALESADKSAEAGSRPGTGGDSKRLFAEGLLVLGHGSIPQRLITRVLYTATQAGFRRFQLGVTSNLATDAIYLLDGVVEKDGEGAPQPPLRLDLGPSTYRLLGEGDAPVASFPAKPFQAADARRGLVDALVARAPKPSPTAPGCGAILLTVDDTLPYSDLIQLLHAIQSRPGVPAEAGCRLVFEQAKGTFTEAPEKESPCLFPFPQILLRQGSTAP